MSKLILVSWIGHADLRAAEGDAGAGIGPIAQAAAFKDFAQIVLLSDYGEARTRGYLAWLGGRTRAGLIVRPVALSSPMHFGEIYQAARQVLGELTAGPSPQSGLTIHLSPGTPAMAAVWILLAKTRFPAELIQSSAAHGVEIASVPFDIAAEFLPDVLQRADRRLGELSAGEPPARAEFLAQLGSRLPRNYPGSISSACSLQLHSQPGAGSRGAIRARQARPRPP